MENWRTITNYQGNEFPPVYEVSDAGNIRRIDDHYQLKPFSDNRGKGYMRIKLFNTKGKRINIKIHRLVATYFLITPEDYKLLEVDHIDSNPKNNNINNLQWVTHNENMRLYHERSNKRK